MDGQRGRECIVGLWIKQDPWTRSCFLPQQGWVVADWRLRTWNKQLAIVRASQNSWEANSLEICRLLSMWKGFGGFATHFSTNPRFSKGLYSIFLLFQLPFNLLKNYLTPQWCWNQVGIRTQTTSAWSTAGFKSKTRYSNTVLIHDAHTLLWVAQHAKTL